MSDVDAILARLEELREDIGELKDGLSRHSDREMTFQREYEREHQIVISKADAAHRRLDDLSKSTAEDIQANADQIKSLITLVSPLTVNYPELEKKVGKAIDDISQISKLIQPLIFTNKVLTWVAAAFGVSIIGLIWSIIIGQVHVVLP